MPVPAPDGYPFDPGAYVGPDAVDQATFAFRVASNDVPIGVIPPAVDQIINAYNGLGWLP